MHEEIKKLSYAILKSIVESDEIHEILKKIVQKGKIGSETPLILVMELKQIRNIIEKKESQEHEIIEGQLLSENESKFIHFLNEEFDQESWLQSLRITLN